MCVCVCVCAHPCIFAFVFVFASKGGNRVTSSHRMTCMRSACVCCVESQHKCCCFTVVVVASSLGLIASAVGDDRGGDEGK